MNKLIARLLGRSGKPTDRPLLSAIYRCAAAGEFPESIASAVVEQGKGLVGDRYHQGSGFWHAVESCQLTLITEHDLSHARQAGTVDVDKGEHRRNLVLSGITARQLAGRRFRIGEALFAYHKPRPPCAYIDTVVGKGMARALGRQSGICLQVLRGGLIRVGDGLTMED